MTIESFENILSLICTIAGLLYGVFKYVETQKRGYRLSYAGGRRGCAN